MTKIERYADKHNMLIGFASSDDFGDILNMVVITKYNSYDVSISKRIQPMEYDMVDIFLKRNYLPLKILVDRAVRKSCAWKIEYNKINLINMICQKNLKLH
jgi:hypothetical protein